MQWHPGEPAKREPGMILHTCCYGMVLVGSSRLEDASDILEWSWLIQPAELHDLEKRRRDEHTARFEQSGIPGRGPAV